MFTIRRLQAVTKVTNDTIFDLQNADDDALPNHTPYRLQWQLDAISSAYSRAGLVVNSKNTEVLYLPPNSSPFLTAHSVLALRLPGVNVGYF